MTKQGDRIKVIEFNDPSTNVFRPKPGQNGTVRFVDVVGKIHVKWDSGAETSLVPGRDEFEITGHINQPGEVKLGYKGKRR